MLKNPSLVAVDYFLPDRDKDLAPPRTYTAASGKRARPHASYWFVTVLSWLQSNAQCARSRLPDSSELRFLHFPCGFLKILY
jgi:hypothetical protein